MKFNEYNQNQEIFKTIIPNELFDKNDPARLMDKVIELLDLSGIRIAIGFVWLVKIPTA